MIKEEIYEEFFNIVKESSEWGIDSDGTQYGYYIDGVVSMVQVLLDKFDQKVIKENYIKEN